MPLLVPLVRQAAPALPNGFVMRCTGCGVSMPTAHDEQDCFYMREERRMKNYEPMGRD